MALEWLVLVHGSPAVCQKNMTAPLEQCQHSHCLVWEHRDNQAPRVQRGGATRWHWPRTEWYAWGQKPKRVKKRLLYPLGKVGGARRNEREREGGGVEGVKQWKEQWNKTGFTLMWCNWIPGDMGLGKRMEDMRRWLNGEKMREMEGEGGGGGEQGDREEDWFQFERRNESLGSWGNRVWLVFSLLTAAAQRGDTHTQFLRPTTSSVQSV